jgi:uncharacterized membrane protein YdbT with pleckstrin-like domain
MDYGENEQVIYEGRPSWRSILAFYIGGIVLVAIAAAIAVLASGAALGAIVGVAALLLLLLIGWLKRVSTRYSITDRRLRIQRGILSRNVEEARVERLQNVSIRQSFVERILQVGTIDFDTASSQQGDQFQFRGIANPGDVVRLVDRAQEAHNERARQPGTAPGAAPAV